MFNLKIFIHYLLLALTLAYLVTGLGVTYYRVVELLTFGLLGKALSMKIHEALIYLFLPALILHIYLKFKR